MEKEKKEQQQQHRLYMNHGRKKRLFDNVRGKIVAIRIASPEQKVQVHLEIYTNIALNNHPEIAFIIYDQLVFLIK